MNFTDYPSSCPPQDSNETDGQTVYRFVKAKRTTVLPEDFKSYYEMNRPCSDVCQCRGLSVYTTKEGVAKTRAQVPGFKKKRVARGELVEGTGRVKNTPGKIKNHHTLWVANDAPRNIVDLFELVED